MPQLRQHPSQLHPLLFATGQLAVVALRQRQAIGLRHHLLDRLMLVAFAVRRPPHADHFLHAERKRQIAVLAHHGSDFGQLLRRPLFQRAIKQATFAAVRRQIAGQQAQRRRFSGAVRADNRYHFTAGKAERYVVDQAARTEAVAQLSGRQAGGVIHRFAPAGASPATSRAADQAGHQPYRHFGRRHQRARQRIADQKQAGAAQRGAGQQPAVIAAEAHAYQMRHHQTDEADHAAHRYRRADQQGAQQQQLQLGALDVHPEVVGLFVPSCNRFNRRACSSVSNAAGRISEAETASVGHCDWLRLPIIHSENWRSC